MPTFDQHADSLLVSPAGETVAERKRQLKAAIDDRLLGQWQIEAVTEELFELRRRRRLPMATAWEQARALDADARIDFAEVDATMPGTEPDLSDRRARPMGFSKGASHKRCSARKTWSLERTRVPQAWRLPLPRGGKRFGEGILIGHPDTGYTDHPQFRDNRVLVRHGFDFEDNDRDARDRLKGSAPGHGAATGSVIMSARDNKVQGTAPAARLIPYRVSEGVIHFKFKSVVRAIDRALKSKVHVLSMSLGGPVHSSSLEQILRRASRSGVIAIAAAGNVWPFVIYPAKLSTVIAMGASNCSDKRWKSSARGSAVTLAAPGESVWRADTTDKGRFRVGRSSGTSYATATMAGICALWLAHHGRDRLITRYGRAQLPGVFEGQLLRHGIRRVSGWNTKKDGAGIVDAHALLKAPLPGRPGRSRVRRFAASEFDAPSPMDRPLDDILDLLPEVPRSSAMQVLARTLHVEEEELSDLAETHGQELRFHLTANLSFRAQVVRAARPRSQRPRGLTARQVTGNEQLSAQSSRSLMGLMQR